MLNEKGENSNKYWEIVKADSVFFEETTKRICKNFYEVLEVELNATQEEIKNAFRRLAMKWHPDKWSGAEERKQKEAEENFKLIYSAYSILGDPKKRRVYDKRESDLEFHDEGEDSDDEESFAREQEEMQAEMERLKIRGERLVRHRFYWDIVMKFFSCPRDGKVKDEDLDSSLWAPYNDWREKMLKMDFDERKLMKFSHEMLAAIGKVSHEKRWGRKKKTNKVNIISKPSDFKNQATNFRVVGESSYSQVANSQTESSHGETRGEVISSESTENFSEQLKKKTKEVWEKVGGTWESLKAYIQISFNQN